MRKLLISRYYNSWMHIQKNWSKRNFLIFAYLALFLLFSACSDKELHPDDVEYRKDENGTKILYQLGNEEPFGKGKRAFMVDYHPNKKDHFKIGFVNGLKDGNFTFWQDNGLPLITGSFKQGKRHGLFTAYGKTGELVYQKKYTNGELDGVFKLYYPSSSSDVSRYFEKLREESMVAGELDVMNHLRLDASFSDGKPFGAYRSYYHPRGKTLTLNELLREEGRFDQNGMLSQEQSSYYPQTHAIVVNMPDNERLDTIHSVSSDGFSRAIDEANREILEIPSYRNPDNAPAYVYAIDERGNEIMPIWSSHIQEIAIRNMNGYLLNNRFEPTYEAFVFDARTLADETLLSMDISTDSETLSKYDREGAAVEVVGLDSNGAIIDILWSSNQSSGVVPLDERIDTKRTKMKRKWQRGIASEANWLLSNGSLITIKDDSTPLESNRFLR